MFGYPALFVGGNLATGLFTRTAGSCGSRERTPPRAVRLPGRGPFSPMPGRAMKGYGRAPAGRRRGRRRAGRLARPGVRVRGVAAREGLTHDESPGATARGSVLVADADNVDVDIRQPRRQALCHGAVQQDFQPALRRVWQEDVGRAAIGNRRGNALDKVWGRHADGACTKLNGVVERLAQVACPVEGQRLDGLLRRQEDDQSGMAGPGE